MAIIAMRGLLCTLPFYFDFALNLPGIDANCPIVTMDMNAPFAPGPANGGPANNGMSFQNGTPPASDMSAPPSGGGQDTPKTTLW